MRQVICGANLFFSPTADGAYTSMRLTLAVQDLKPGMYVVELDISWLDSPFFSKSLRITGIKEVEQLIKAGVKQVVIDTDKGVAPAVVAKSAPQPVPPPPPVKSVPVAPEKRSLEQELQVANGLRTKIKKAVDNIQAALERNNPVEMGEVSGLIDQTLNSLERNNQALLSLAHLSRKAQKLADHCFSTFCICLNVALNKSIPVAEREALGIAALLHEAGWVQLPLQLMGKRVPYTPVEKQLIQQHVQQGLALLSHSELPELSKRIILEHHEYCDGSGYPNALKAPALHPLSKLLTVVDAYDERVHQLSDKPGMLPTLALRTLYVDAERGLFDSTWVATLIALLGIYPVTSAVRLNTGERALVLEVGEEPLSPRIKILYDANKKLLPTPLVIDLKRPPADAPKRLIEGLLDPSNPQDDPFRRLTMED